MSTTPEEFMQGLAGKRVYATVALGLVTTLYQGVLTKDPIPPARWHLVPDDAGSPLQRVILFIEDGECDFELQAEVPCLSRPQRHSTADDLRSEPRGVRREGVAAGRAKRWMTALAKC